MYQPRKIAANVVLTALLVMSAGSFYPYYQSINSRSLVGDFCIGLALWVVIKGLEIFPSIVADGSSQYLVQMVALGIDGAISQSTFRLSPMTLSNSLMLSLSLISPLLTLRVLGRSFGFVTKPNPTELPTSIYRTPHIEQPNSAQSPVAHPQNYTASAIEPYDRAFVTHPQSTSLLSILTKTPVSTILVGEPGTGKTMTGSSMGRQWVRDGHHVFYIDSKMDEKELNLWDDACSDRYQFDGTMIRDPNEWCKRLIEAFDEFEDFRLRHLNDGKQTICILDELPAVISAFKSYKPDPAAALNFINRIVNTLPSRNCHVLLLAQNPSCSDTLPTGTIGTLKKIILAKSGSESQLAEWGNLTMMRSVKLDTLSAAIRKSPIDRGCYYSVKGEWMPMESWIRDGDYNRDTLSGGAVLASENTQNWGDSDVNARTHAGLSDSASTLTLDVLAYFENVNTEAPRTVRDIRMGSRIRKSGASAEEVEMVLSQLCQEGQLARTSDGWQSLNWDCDAT